MNMKVPTTEAVAEAAAQAVATLRELAAVDGEPDQASGPPFFADRAAISGLAQPQAEVHGQLLDLALSGMQVSWESAVDHLAALEADLRRRPFAVWSTMTTVRAVQESVIFVYYLAEPGLSTDERLARIADTWLEDADNNLKASPDLSARGGPNLRTQALADRAFCVSELRRGGFEVTTSTEGAPRSITLGAARISKIGFLTTERARLLMPVDAPEAYRLASGAAHARPWFLTKNAILEPGDGWAAEASTTTSSVSIAASAVEAGIRVLGGFYGVDTSAVEAQIHQVHKDFMTLMAAYGVGVMPPEWAPDVADPRGQPGLP